MAGALIGSSASDALRRLTDQHGLAGAQYLMADASSVLAECCAGFADALRVVEVTPSTTFNLYSLTKPFTAAAALRLARRGAFRLEDSIADAAGLPALERYGSVLHTLRHAAGFPNPLPLRWVHLASEDLAFDEAAFVEHQLTLLRGQRPHRAAAKYSNLGYLALGRALERVTGEPFRQLLATHVLDPLPFVEGGRLCFEIGTKPDHAFGHLSRHRLLDLSLGWMLGRARIVDDARGKWVRLRHHHVNGSAYGGLVGNARGVLRFARACLATGGDLGPDSWPSVLAIAAGVEGHGTPGWVRGRWGAYRWFAHAGGGLGYYAEMRLYPSLGVASVLLTNTAGLRYHGWLEELDRAVLPPAGSASRLPG